MARDPMNSGEPAWAVQSVASDASARRLRSHPIAGALVLGLLTALICALALWRSWEAALQRADAEARNLAILIDRNVSTVLNTASVVLGSTAAQLEHQIAGPGIERRWFWSLVDSQTALVPEIAQIGVFDAQGQQVCGEPASRCRQLNVADRDYFQQLRAFPEETTRLFGPYRSRVDGLPSLVLARPLHDGGGSFAGVAIALIPLQRLEALLAAVDVGRNGVVALRGMDLGLLLRHPAPTPATQATGSGAASDEFTQAVRAAPEEGSYRGASRLDGIERQSRYRRLSAFPLCAIVGLGTRDYLAPWRAQAYWTLGFLALFVASSAVIARLLLGTMRDQQRIHSLYDNAPCGYHSLDADGIYRRINATELQWLGCTRDEVIGKLGPMDFCSAGGKAVFRRHFPTYQQTGRLEGLEYDLLSRDGTLRRVVVSATALHDAQGRFALSNTVMYDITELHAARQELKRFVDRLEERVGQRTHEIRRLAAELDAAENRERQQLARDLHDDLGQTLAAQLAPPMLYDLGLTEALEWLGDEIERSFGLKVAVIDDGEPKPLSHEARSIIFRATRELLINSAKHARADGAEVEIERHGDQIVVRVAESGVGFDATLFTAAKGQGMGLLSVRERLSFIGGSVDIRSIPGDGAIITLTAPLTPAHEGAEA